jgi:hypothetical protein
MNYLAAILLLVATHTAEAGKKPACNAAHHGRLWPAEANGSTEAARQFYQRGELEMCSLDVWKYKWQRLSVNVHELSKRTQQASNSAAQSALPR